MRGRRSKIATDELSHYCWSALADAADKLYPTQTVNSGVLNKLCRLGLITIVMRPSPYQRSKGQDIGHVQITDKGRERLKERQ